MRTSARPTAPKRRGARALAVPLLAAAIVAGCGGATTSRDGADTERGKDLFAKNCGSCHVLADAGTNGQVGPNLDHAFLAAREDGLGESTFFEVTLEQMRIPAAPMPDFDDPDSETRLSEDELVDIAHYVALCAGHAGKRKPAECAGPPEGPQAVFVASCGSCHALDAAGTTGTTGPSLDESKPGLQEAITQIKKGGGGMPAFEGKLSDEQINALAKYIVESTGGS